MTVINATSFVKRYWKKWMKRKENKQQIVDVVHVFWTCVSLFISKYNYLHYTQWIPVQLVISYYMAELIVIFQC